MRSTIATISAFVLLALQQPLPAQWMAPPTPPPAVPNAEPYGYGNSVPVAGAGRGSPPSAYAMHLTDDPASGMPAGSAGCGGMGGGCDCGACCEPLGGLGRRYGRLGCEGLGCGGVGFGGLGFGGFGCGSCRGTELADRVFGSAEYMIWYNNGINLPPLVTTSPIGTVQTAAGVLPNATILFGGTDIDDDRQAGARYTIGVWADDQRNLGVGAKFYGVEGGAVRFGQGANGTPIIARPFFDADPIINAENSLLVSFPGVAVGSVDFMAANDIVGTDVYLRTLLDQGRSYRIDLMAGWQYNRIDSDLIMNSQHTAGATTFVYNDLFTVENEYNAGTLGLYTEIYRDRLTFSALGKIAIGSMSQQVDINGSNTRTVGAGAPVTTAGGLLAQPTNIGTFDQDVLTWSPEVNFKLNYEVTQRISLSVGYTFLYWTRVSFAGDQVDRVVNSTQLNGGAPVGPARPAFGFPDTDFWVQSLDLGVSWNY